PAQGPLASSGGTYVVPPASSTVRPPPPKMPLPPNGPRWAPFTAEGGSVTHLLQSSPWQQSPADRSTVPPALPPPPLKNPPPPLKKPPPPVVEPPPDVVPPAA